jgi:hypothetical protein
VDYTDPNTHRDNLLNSYGLISLERVRSAEAAYIRTETRMMQDTKMLYECLLASLTEEARNAIELWRSDFTIGGIGSGVLLLWVIIRESHLDSNAATSVIRTQLSRLDEYMPTVMITIPKGRCNRGWVQLKGIDDNDNDNETFSLSLSLQLSVFRQIHRHWRCTTTDQ